MPRRSIVFDHGWATRLSRRRRREDWIPSEEDLEGFRLAQTLGFRCAQAIGGEIREGWTERRAARAMDEWLRDHGVSGFFHTSFAWVAERSRFEDFDEARVLPEVASYRHFLPTDRVIRPGDVVILDTAPMVDGYTGDIGWATSLGEHAGLTKVRRFLATLRREIRDWFASPMTTRHIWAEADRRIRAAGYENRHALYPFSVLGHRLRPTHLARLPAVTRPLSVQAFGSLAAHGLFPDLLGPFHEGDKTGFWAIEPHLGAGGFGAKFEEILVVEPGNVRWLDDRFAP